MAEMRSYTIGKNKIEKAFLRGFLLEEGGNLRLFGEDSRHEIFFRKLDSVEKNASWGRLHLEYELPLESVCIVSALVLNEKELISDEGVFTIDEYLCDAAVSTESKEAFFLREECLRFVNCRDMLLYGKKGRYLWLWIQVLGEGSGKLGGIHVQKPGDNFLATFPEIYQEEGSFFHRFLSVFSSIYQDFQGKIDHMEEWLDFDTAPAKLLPVYSSWLGLDIDGGFLDEKRARALLKEVSHLNRMKGTKECLKRVIRIVWEKDAVLVERSRMSDYINSRDEAVYEMLYGKSLYDVTILIEGKADESLRSRLLFLLNQFKPLRARLNLVFLSECAIMDSYCYLDWNAQICGTPDGELDQHKQFDQSRIL